jgi:enoyl-CoA hydratase
MIEIEDKGSISTIRLVRGKGNALNLELATALTEALDKFEKSPARAGIITGQGNVFGAGVDLMALIEGSTDYANKFLPQLMRLFQRLATFPKPLVAAVNGHAIAGGAIMMLACDQRLLARGKARIGLSEVVVGVVFPAWAIEIARFATPPQHFPTLICTGRTWLPEDALARGLVDELVEPEKLLDRAFEVATELAAIPPAVYSTTKMAVRRPMFEAAREQAAKTDAAVMQHWLSPETMRTIAKFAEQNIKRKAE